MEENKYICPNCGGEMECVYDKPALNLTCPKCGCKIATSRWDDIDLDPADYQITLESVPHPSIDNIKLVSSITGLNFIHSKALLENGGIVAKENAVKTKEIKTQLDDENIRYLITPDFKY